MLLVRSNVAKRRKKKKVSKWIADWHSKFGDIWSFQIRLRAPYSIDFLLTITATSWSRDVQWGDCLQVTVWNDSFDVDDVTPGNSSFTRRHNGALAINKNNNNNPHYWHILTIRKYRRIK